jgi:RNA polymerase sigma-70 factor (ECF subfamily)
MPEDQSDRQPNAGRGFATTQWSVVMAAGDDHHEEAFEALSRLCESYWYPLYAYVRRRTSENEARDLTQSFFAHLLDKNTVAAADQTRGRFRAFLLTALKNFLTNEWAKERAVKRGGGATHLSLDFEDGDSRLRIEPSAGETPEHLYERQWAMALLDRVLSRLREEYVAAGKERQFDLFKPFIAGAGGDYQAAAKRLGWTDNAVRVAAHRLRGRYRELLRAEIAHTVGSLDDVDDEIRWLFQVLG